ncbi:hypothetical protein EV122DRAFT_285411 [Schizophyllum commune]
MLQSASERLEHFAPSRKARIACTPTIPSSSTFSTSSTRSPSTPSPLLSLPVYKFHVPAKKSPASSAEWLALMDTGAFNPFVNSENLARQRDFLTFDIAPRPVIGAGLTTTDEFAGFLKIIGFDEPCTTYESKGQKGIHYDDHWPGLPERWKARELVPREVSNSFLHPPENAARTRTRPAVSRSSRTPAVTVMSNLVVPRIGYVFVTVAPSAEDDYYMPPSQSASNSCLSSFDASSSLTEDSVTTSAADAPSNAATYDPVEVSRESPRSLSQRLLAKCKKAFSACFSKKVEYSAERQWPSRTSSTTDFVLEPSESP